MESGLSITAEEIARLTGGRLHGDGGRAVSRVAPLNEAGPDSLSWIGDPKYLPQLMTTRAGVILVPHGCDVPGGTTAVAVDDPDLACCRLLAALAPPPESVPPGVDPAARVGAGAVVDGACIGPNVVVGPRAVVGAGTQLHAGVYVGAGCQIGRDCVLWPNVVVREGTTLGDRVILHPSVTIGADGFSYLQREGRNYKVPQIGRVVIEDEVEIGANSCVDRARSGVTRIGRGTKIDNLVQIGHNVRTGEHCIIVAQCAIGGSCTLGNHVVLGGGVATADHVRVGDGVRVVGLSGVTHDVPDGMTVRGLPAADHREYARETMALRRLPKIIKEFRALVERVKRLEQAANDTE